MGYKLWGRRCERDCPIEYSASLEAVEVSKENISVGTHLQELPTASLLSVMFVFFKLKRLLMMGQKKKRVINQYSFSAKNKILQKNHV